VEKTITSVQTAANLVPTDHVAVTVASTFVADRAAEKAESATSELIGKGCELACLGTTATAEESLTLDGQKNKKNYFLNILVEDAYAEGFLEKAYQKHPWLEPVIMLSSFAVGTGIGMIKAVSEAASTLHYSAPKRITYMSSVGAIVGMGLAFNLRANKMLKREKEALESILEVVDQEASVETTDNNVPTKNKNLYAGVVSQTVKQTLSAPKKMNPLSTLCITPRGCNGKGAGLDLSPYQSLGVPALREVTQLGQLLDGQKNYQSKEKEIFGVLDTLIAKSGAIKSYVKTYQTRINQNLMRQGIPRIDFEAAKNKGVDLLLKAMDEAGAPVFDSSEEQKSYLASLSKDFQNEDSQVDVAALPIFSDDRSSNITSESEKRVVLNNNEVNEYEIEVNTIIKNKNGDLFKVISNRYLSTGLQLLEVE